MENIQDRKSLDDYGVIFITGAIDNSTASSVCEEIIKINMEGKSEFIQMIINSPGGSVPAGFAIIDMMEWSALPVYTTGIGMIASMALAIFVSGENNRRIITPRTSILCHRFFTMTGGNYSDLVANRKEEDFLHGRLVEHYMLHSNLKNKEDVEKHILRDVDTWLTSEEALAFGLIDKIQSIRTKGARV